MINRIISLLLLLILLPVFLIVCFVIVMDDGFPIFYKQKRVGQYNQYFEIIKFRTMKTNTKDVATHLIGKFESNILLSGHFLRKFSIDELPQLINIIKGQMNFIGPRPALYNQYDLIALRTEKGVSKLLPGITGWAQVNGRDELSIPDKVALDVEYLNRQSFWFDIKILCMTFLKVVKHDGVSH